MSAADMFLESCPSLTRLMDLRSWVRKASIHNLFLAVSGRSLSQRDWATGEKDRGWRLGTLHWKGLGSGKTWKHPSVGSPAHGCAIFLNRMFWTRYLQSETVLLISRWQNKHWKGPAWRRSMTSWEINLEIWLWFHDKISHVYHPWVIGFDRNIFFNNVSKFLGIFSKTWTC